MGRSSARGVYRVKCRACGWEGETLLRGYVSSFYYVECPRCGSRLLMSRPPPPGTRLKIGTTPSMVVAGAALILLGAWATLVDALVKHRNAAVPALVGAAVFAALLLVLSCLGAGTIEAALASLLGGAFAGASVHAKGVRG